MSVLGASVLFLICLAALDLWVGVSNDAVNFLNSAIGAQVASRRTIMIVASVGVVFGALFSSGMMEVARKGVFNPDVFLDAQGSLQIGAILAVYLGVMVADVIMLDLFNTLGLPTSTTVSIVSELLGASIAVVFWMTGGDIMAAFGAINTGPVVTIYTGIFLSVLVSFTAGAIGMFGIRYLFTHDIKAGFERWGWLWTGLSFAALFYFVMFKGLKHASFITADMSAFLKTHVWTLMAGVAVVSAVIGLALRKNHRLIFSVIILVGTFGLAVAFAGNDLVNFIGPAVAAAQAVFVEGVQLSGQVATPSWALLAAGVMMVLALTTSKKAQTVSDTEIRLAAGGEREQRFKENVVGRVIVGAAAPLGKLATALLPASLNGSIQRRCAPPPGTIEGPPYDLLRASVNLIISAAIISIGTANKLPLSTTYITFMVAMGASFADGTWAKGSAKARVSGMATVMGGWLATGVIAATGAFITGSIIYLTGVLPFGEIIGIVLMATVVVFSLRRSSAHHDKVSANTTTVVDEI